MGHQEPRVLGVRRAQRKPLRHQARLRARHHRRGSDLHPRLVPAVAQDPPLQLRVHALHHLPGRARIGGDEAHLRQPPGDELNDREQQKFGFVRAEFFNPVFVTQGPNARVAELALRRRGRHEEPRGER